MLPRLPDELAPRVDCFRIKTHCPTDEPGPSTTAMRQVFLNAIGSDNPGGSGVAKILYVEYEFIQSVSAWAPRWSSGWLPYSVSAKDFPRDLIPSAGLHYLRAWVVDRSGNISVVPYTQSINYVPQATQIRHDQVHVYRQTLAAGQQLDVRLTPSNGDADLYIWPPASGEPAFVSNLSGSRGDRLTITANRSGVYQIEVYGYTDATYSLEIDLDTTTTAARLAPVGIDPNKPPRNTPATSYDSAPSLTGIPTPSPRFEIYVPLIMR